MSRRGVAVVSSVIATKHGNGGNAWAVLSWILGLRRLGFDVCFVEQIGRAQCVDADGRGTAFRDSVNLEYFRAVVAEFGLGGMAALVYDDGADVEGMSSVHLREIAGEADVLFNITGHLTLEPVKSAIRRRAYVDFDPGFTQFWHAAGDGGPRLDGHHFYFTIGENIGTARSGIPTSGIPWRPTRQPVVLDDWPVAPSAAVDPFTTVASWRGAYAPVTYGGRTFGLKVHEFRKFVEVPARTGREFEIALDIHPADERDRRLLEAHGWRTVDPRLVAADPGGFRKYVQGSGAEFSVAQGIYVATRSGWFSDRTVRYLASGKPVLVQDTGFSDNLPVGSGLLAFGTVDEAVAGVDAIARDYGAHCRAARALAAEYFDSDRILGALLEQVGAAP